jgi:hypothetical protein
VPQDDPNNRSPFADKQDLILRGLHILIRTSFSPNDQQAQMKHFVGLQKDIGPWLSDYAAAFAPQETTQD